MKYNLTYVNAEQFVEDTATAIIKEHLDWSNSLDSDMKDRVFSVRGEALEVWENHFADCIGEQVGFDWDCKEYHVRLRFATEAEFNPMFNEAMRLANRKWDAVRLILGI